MNQHGLLSDEEWQALFAGAEAAVKANPNHPLMVGKPEGNPVQTRPPWDPNPDRWEQGVTQVGGQRWVQGIRAPRRDFKVAALENNAGWKAGVTQAVAGDKFAKGMGTVDVDEALATAEAVGAQGYAAGAVARKNKFRRNTDAIKARMAAAVEATRRMPATTLQERVNRAVNFIQGAAAAGAGGTPGRA